ncbi:oligosaccharide flippase family protein [Enterovibrio sp. ZSDZ35]|uniref:Oligosaccharide flippase family protein n=1 Tax=Enterovibrio qingdaonensis TaxID=2899818 RepID=A0ABT5QN81_9GAMM|nr:oligosaccharide flippase family protein [Enterovibrio sp. ZSDZ35]MDD1782452.1 oligosaccharide flippase family protein [Enterovibrio sp. ZSDZ35]
MKSNLFKGSLIYVSGSILTSLVPFILLPILTRYLSQEDYGQLAIFQTLISFVSAFAGLSVIGSVSRKYFEIKDEEEKLANYNGGAIVILLISSLIITLIFFLFQNEIRPLIGIDVDYIYMSILISSCSFLIQLRLTQWQIRENPFSYFLFVALQGLANLIITIIAVVIMEEGLDGRVYTQAIISIILSIWSLHSLKVNGLLAFSKISIETLSEKISFGVPFIPTVVGGLLLTMIDRYVISQKFGLSEAGIYMVAAQLSSVFAIVFHAINKAYSPWLFKTLTLDNYSDKVKIVRLTYCYFALLLVVAVLMFHLSPLIVNLIVGQNYSESAFLLPWLVIGQIFVGMYLMVTNYIFYVKSTSILSIVTLTSGGVNVFLLIVLLERFSLSGAAYAFCISMFFRFILVWLAAHSSYPMPWLKFYKRREYETN